YILKDSRTIYPIMVFTPAIVFIALSAVLKGYFYGMERVSIPSIIDIGEKAIRLVFLVFATKYFMNMGIEFICVGAMLAMVCGELLSLILLFSFYKFYSKTKIANRKKSNSILLIRSILTPLIPLSFGGNIESILDMIDAVLIPSKLVKAGFTKSEALSIFGELTGMVIPLLYFPMIIIASLSTT
ncbi:MAG: stage V sporulation protein B, partial [Clostridiales bacterium]|nr:stage V sporulation protein B [Clostridiales bacterium]